ncbi:MAG: MerR family DNA-binding transcriptional regulator [Chloroflexota bacterium]
MKVSIARAAEILGVSITTLRRWDAEGKLKAERTAAGHRRYYLQNLRKLVIYTIDESSSGRKTAVYARVSSSDEQELLEKQIQLLLRYCHRFGWEPELFSDVGDGKNGRLSQLAKLVKLLCTEQIERLILLNHTRLSPTGLALVSSLCADFQVQMIFTNQALPKLQTLHEPEVIFTEEKINGEGIF